MVGMSRGTIVISKLIKVLAAYSYTLIFGELRKSNSSSPFQTVSKTTKKEMAPPAIIATVRSPLEAIMTGFPENQNTVIRLRICFYKWKDRKRVVKKYREKTLQNLTPHYLTTFFFAISRTLFCTTTDFQWFFMTF